MRRLGTVLVVPVLVLPAVAAAAPSQLPDRAAERVASARTQAAAMAEEFTAEKARGHKEDKTTGLARAAEVSDSWRFTGEKRPGHGNGRALGVGHSDAVQDALANGESPSSLDSHGEAVSAAAHEMKEAFQGMKAKAEGHPGEGQGKGLGGPGGGEGDD